MIRFDQPDRCAFCGQLIGPDEPKSGRGETAAHVRCADAALADDRFWDRIAAGMGDSAPPEPAVDVSQEPSRREAAAGGDDDRPRTTAGSTRAGARSGCALAAGVLLALVVLVARP